MGAGWLCCWWPDLLMSPPCLLGYSCINTFERELCAVVEGGAQSVVVLGGCAAQREMLPGVHSEADA